MARPLAVLALVALVSATSAAHDIPNARVDRSIQATLAPGRLRVEYEVSLSELTLTQDLRRLVDDLPGGDRRAWFEEYGKVVGPMNGRGFLVQVDGAEIDLRFRSYDLAIEGHPRYTFHFEAEVPDRGRLSLIDTNYVAAEGTSRLAIRPQGKLSIQGDSLPTEVEQIPIRPVWQLSPDEEPRTRRVSVEFSPSATIEAKPPVAIVPPNPSPPPSNNLSRLLDDTVGKEWGFLCLAAFVLGAAHAIQPGHGKTLVAASSLDLGGRPLHGAALGLATAVVHMGSVALIALALWATRSIRPAEVHVALARGAGFTIAAIGLWRLGRHLAGYRESDHSKSHANPTARGLIPIALAGGMVPCWDAVVLVLVSEAIGRLPLGLALLVAFSLGMAAVLVAVGLLAGRFRASFGRSNRPSAWERRLGIAGALILTAVGLSLLRSA